MKRIPIYLFLVALFLVIQAPAANSEGDLNVEVEIETGPKFDPSDADTVWGCVQAHYHQKFPFDFYAAPSLGGGGCPSATFWNKQYEMCWLLDLFHIIEPAMILGLLISAILWL